MARLRLRSAPEHEIQRGIVKSARDLVPFYPDFGLLFMINNASNGLDYKMWGWLESMGLLPGLPDLCLPVARGGAFGRWLEVKVDEGETKKAIARIAERRGRKMLSKADEHLARQMTIHDLLRAAGHLVDFVFSPKQGIDLLLQYVKLPRTVAVPFASGEH